MEGFEEDSNLPVLRFREVCEGEKSREDEESREEQQGDQCCEDELDAASNISLGESSAPATLYDPTVILCPDPTSPEVSDELMETVAMSYEEKMASYLLERPSIEDIMVSLEKLSPHVEALTRLHSSDFLDWEGPPLAVALHVAAVSGPRMWVPLHLEMRRKCGYVK